MFMVDTYAEDAVYEWIAAAIAHSQPMTAEEYYVNVAIPVDKERAH